MNHQENQILRLSLLNCNIEKRGNPLIKELSWCMKTGEAWLITGPNGGGKSALAAGLAGQLDILPQPGGNYSNIFAETISLVSFETAAALIEEERKRDDSDFIEGGIDPGRTTRSFIAEILPFSEINGSPNGRDLENHQVVLLCGISSILDRGLKFLSTGEIKRCLLCRALISQPSLLIIDEPYEGLDSSSRAVFSTLLEKMAGETANEKTSCPTALLLLMDRFECIPKTITHILELSHLSVSFSGLRSEYEALLQQRATIWNSGILSRISEMQEILHSAKDLRKFTLSKTDRTTEPILVEMKNVTVEWSGKKVLDNLSLVLRKGEHLLIRGPNGSGKTTLLELITGDNPQVFRNEVYLFGSRRGSGETIWELKEKMGIVSYRLHLDYRYFPDLSLEEILVSGLHDTIGLYQQCGDEEFRLAVKWLQMAGFGGREKEKFATLSYGEQRAILIVRAAIKCPPLLILDEPCHGLDTDHCLKILDLLEAIAEGGGSTLLHVTHDPTEQLSCEKNILELFPDQIPMYKIISNKLMQETV